MHNFKVPRKQGDGLGDEYTQIAAKELELELAKHPDMARQEFAAETNINNILDRFGVTGNLPNRKNVAWGTTVDYDVDLQTALSAISETRGAYRRLPKEVREAYPSWQLFLNAVARGEITMRDVEESVPSAASEKQPPSTDSASNAGSASRPGDQTSSKSDTVK